MLNQLAGLYYDSKSDLRRAPGSLVLLLLVKLYLIKKKKKALECSYMIVLILRKQTHI